MAKRSESLGVNDSVLIRFVHRETVLEVPVVVTNLRVNFDQDTIDIGTAGKPHTFLPGSPWIEGHLSFRCTGAVVQVVE